METHGRYTCHFHTGIDFPKSQMSDPHLYACCSGTIVKNVTGVTGSSPALGNETDILRGDGICFRYCHMENGSNNHLSVGQTVDTNTLIGITGNTGNSTGPHLHLEASQGTAWNCQTFLSPGDVLGFGNTRGTVIVYEGTPVPPDPPDPPDPPGPGPDPHEPIVRDKFPWVLYADKFRRKRGSKNG